MADRGRVPAATSNEQRRRGLGRIIISDGISVTGDWALNTAASIAVFRETGSTAAVSVLLALALIPTVLVAPFAGAIADRRDRRTILVAMDVISGLVLVVATAAAAAGFRLEGTYAAVLTLAVLATFRRPAAAALRASIAGDEQLARANSLIQTATRLAMIAGPAAASGLMSTGGLELTLAADAATFGASALLVTGVPRVPIRAGQNQVSAFAASLDGLRFARDNRGVRTVVATIGVVMLVAPIVNAGTLPLVKDELGVPESRYGILLAAEGVGALGLALVFTALGSRLRLIPAGIAATLLTGASTVLLGAAAAMATAIAAMALMGVGLVAFQVAFASYLQRETPDEFRGRVMSLASMTAAIAGLAGFAFVGPLIYAVGVRPAFWLAGIVICLTALPVSGLAWRTRREALGQPSPSSG